MKTFHSILSLFFIGGMLFSCNGNQTPLTTKILPPKQATVTGTINIIWNDEPLYTITDDQGQQTTLLIDEETAKTVGGPLAIDRQRATVVGEVVSESPKTLNVQSIQLETPASEQVTITGIINIIWNDEPLYTITDDQGQQTTLLIDEETAKTVGGPLAIDRQRATVVGEVVSESPKTVRVQSIQLESTNSEQVTITGWLNIIWNDEPLYTITDDQGQQTTLLIDEETAKTVGGPLAIDRQRITIVGEVVSESPKTVNVQSIQLETPASEQVTITGIINIIWNGEPLYTITDDQGQQTTLLIDEEVAKTAGGPLEIDQKRVTIVGEVVSESPRTVRVLYIYFANA